MTDPWWTRRLLPVAVVASLLVAAPALADPATERAKAHNQQAKKLFSLGRFAEAAQEYNRAYVAKPVPVFLFNLAQCYKRLGAVEDLRKAVFYYRSYLRNEQFTPMRESVEEEIAKLEHQIKESSRPPPPPPFYKRWWFWTVVGAVVVGATVGTAMALRPQDEQPYKPTAIDFQVP